MTEDKSKYHRYLVVFGAVSCSILDLTLLEQQQMVDILADRKPQTVSDAISSVFRSATASTEIWLVDSDLSRVQLTEKYIKDSVTFEKQIRDAGELMHKGKETC